jgi:hypothetical protein
MFNLPNVSSAHQSEILDFDMFFMRLNVTFPKRPSDTHKQAFSCQKLKVGNSKRQLYIAAAKMCRKPQPEKTAAVKKEKKSPVRRKEGYFPTGFINSKTPFRVCQHRQELISLFV